MSEFITASNIDQVIRKNREIAEEVSSLALTLRTNHSVMMVASVPQLALLILQGYGLVQIPIEDRYWSGAIFVKDGKRIPVINTALPRANQYFTAWHEIYHLLFDYVSLDHFIEADQTLEERKAEYFAAKMLLNDVERYYAELSEMDFLSRIFCCMSAYQAPYKAVLISLYEYAEKIGFKKLQDQIREVFDLQINDLADRFKSLGLDDSLVKPSYVINTGYLQGKIREQKKENPELTYHEDNEAFLENIKKELTLLTGKNSDKN